jgi:GST-like protein
MADVPDGRCGSDVRPTRVLREIRRIESRRPVPRQRYIDEAKRLLNVVEGALKDRDWIAGEYSIADIALRPGLARSISTGAKDLVGWNDLKNVPAYLDRFLQGRPCKKAATSPREG